MALASLLQLVQIEGFHGRMRFAAGALGFAAGRLVEARFLDLSGREAALEALLRARGRFSLVPDTAEREGPALSIQHLILDAVALTDEWHRVAGLVPCPQTPPPAPVLRAVWMQADGVQPLAALVARTGAFLVHVVPPLADALRGDALPCRGRTDPDLAALEVRAEPAPAADGDEDAFDACVFRARRLARQRRFSEAEVLLRRALAQRPDSPIARQNLRRIRAMAHQTGFPGTEPPCPEPNRSPESSRPSPPAPPT